MVVSSALGGFQQRSFRKSLAVNTASGKACITPQSTGVKVARSRKRYLKARNEKHSHGTHVEGVVVTSEGTHLDRESSEEATEEVPGEEFEDVGWEVVVDGSTDTSTEGALCAGGTSQTGHDQNRSEREDAQLHEQKIKENSQVVITKRKLFDDCYRMSSVLVRKSDHDLFESYRRCDEEKVLAASYRLPQDEGIPRGTVRDIAFRKGAEHPNILQFLEAFLEPSKAIVISSFAGTTLTEFINASYAPSYMVASTTNPRFTMDEALIKSLCMQLLLGVEFCHSHRVILSNLKTPNISIDSSLSPPRLRIGGFASATPAWNEERFGIAMTATFLSPELLLGSKTEGLEADMWSAGCILGEMATGIPLFFNDNTEIGTLMKIFQQLGTPTESSWPGVSKLPDFGPNFPKWRARPWNLQDKIGGVGVALLELLLNLDPRCRVSARRALKHPWFAALLPFRKACSNQSGAVSLQHRHIDSHELMANDLSKFRNMFGSCTTACSKRPFLNVPDALALVDAFVGQSHASQYVEYLRDMDSFARQTEATTCVPREDFWFAKGEDRQGKFRYTFEEGLRCRAILVDWMVGVCKAQSLRESTLFLAVAYVDQYIGRKQINPGKFQCLGCAAMFIASKFEDDAQIEGSWLVHMTDGSVKQNDLEQMELDVLNTIDFNLNMPVVPYFLDRFLNMNGCDEAHRCLVHYLTELTLINIMDFQYPPSQIAAAAVLLSNRLLKRTDAWLAAMKVRTGYTEHAECTESLDECVEKLHTYMRNLRNWPNKAPHQSIYKAYATKFDHSVLEDD